MQSQMGGQLGYSTLLFATIDWACFFMFFSLILRISCLKSEYIVGMMNGRKAANPPHVFPHFSSSG